MPAAAQAGEFALTMTRMKMQFVLALGQLASTEGREWAGLWEQWYKRPKPGLTDEVRDRVENPGTIQLYLQGDRPQLGGNKAEQKAALAALENLKHIRDSDPASFDALLGTQTRDPGLLRAFIKDRQGRFHFRGLKPIQDFTPMEKKAAGYTLTEKEQRHVAGQDARWAARQPVHV